MFAKEIRLFRIHITGACAAVAILVQPHASWAQKVEITNENGVAVIHNPKSPVPLPGALSEVFLREDLVIGNQREKEDYWFSFINSLDVDASGNIYTIDPKDVRIRVFDPQGKLLRAFGRKGQGPEEFSGPGSIQVTSNGKLLVFDVLNSRLSLLTPDGKSIRNVPSGVPALIVIKSDARGFLYCLKTGVKENKRTQEILRYDPSLNPVRTISSFERSWNPRVINPFPETYFADVTQNGDLVWGLTSAYRMDVVDPEGKVLRRILKDHDPIKITPADRQRYLAKYASLHAPIRFEYEFPDYYPPVSRIIIDDRDQIFAQTYEKDMQGGIRHDVFSADGRYLGRFTLPENERMAVVKNNKLYCMIMESDEGVPLVKRYTLFWK